MRISGVNMIGIQNRLRESDKALGRVIGQLSSGSRLSPFRGDIASASISNTLNSKIRGLSRSTLDLNMGVTITQTMEQAVSAQTELVQKMRELSLQAMNGSLNAVQRGALQDELNVLLAEFENITNNTDFNGKKLLNGTAESQALSILDAGNKSFALGSIDRRSSEIFQTLEPNFDFSNQTSISETGIAGLVRMVDLNGNGVLDMVRRTSDSSMRIEVRLGKSDGSFFEPIDNPTLNSVYVDFQLADVTGNGHLDFVGINSSGIWVAEGDGVGSFSETTTLYTTGSPSLGGREVQIADLNGNGYMDIIMAHGTGSIKMFINDGVGGFEEENISLAAGVILGHRLRAGDFTGNGFVDLFVLNENSGVGELLEGVGDGSFTSGGTDDYSDATSTIRIDAADLTGNGVLDLIVGGAGNTNANIYINDGAGGLSLASTINAGANIRNVYFQDLNQNGIYDLALVTNSETQLFTGSADGSFTLQSTNNLVGHLAFGDLNDNGLIDIISNFTNDVNVALQSGEWTSALDKLSLDSIENAERTLSILDLAIQKSIDDQSAIGVKGNVLEMMTRSNESMLMAWQESHEELRSLDFAEATTELVRLQILQSAQIAVMSQALSQSEAILQVLSTLNKAA